MTGASIAIVTDSSDQFWHHRSLVKLMIPAWRAMGLRVEVVTETDAPVDADIALLHVARSVVPDALRRVVDNYPRVLNGTVLDIRKRSFSRLLVDREPRDVSGPVIVKTDWNYGGWPEFVRHAEKTLAGRVLGKIIGRRNALHYLNRIESRRSWRRRRTLRPYVVYANRQQVPPGVWDNENLVVERFVPERQGNLYSCRHWLFLGDAEVFRRTVSPDPMVKLAAAPPIPLQEPVPERLRALRTQLGFDYGKFDYGIVDGEVVLYDTNRTPGATTDPAVHDETINVLSKGVLGFLAAPAPQ